jgi:RNA polymerase sigma-70 factor (family 1)
MARYSDIEIIEGLQRADHSIMSYLWDELAPRLQYFAENFIRNKHDAEEIISTVFLKLPKASSRFTSLDHVKSFLYISAKHKCLDYLRRKQAHQRRQLHYESHVSETAEPEEAAAERIYLKSELIHAIYKEMQKLPENCRQIFELTYLEGLNAREISDKLNIAVSTVTTQRSRAIKFLREVLSHREFVTLLILLNSIP